MLTAAEMFRKAGEHLPGGLQSVSDIDHLTLQWRRSTWPPICDIVPVTMTMCRVLTRWRYSRGHVTSLMMTMVDVTTLRPHLSTKHQEDVLIPLQTIPSPTTGTYVRPINDTICDPLQNLNITPIRGSELWSLATLICSSPSLMTLKRLHSSWQQTYFVTYIYVCMYVCGFMSRNPYSLSSHENV